MSKPIGCLSEILRQYLEEFRSCFSKRQWKYFVAILLGLVECDERNTMGGLRRWVAEGISLSGRPRFMSRWSWPIAAVAHSWMKRLWERQPGKVQAEHERRMAEMPKSVGRSIAAVVTGYLIFDDSIHIRSKGGKTGRLGQHFSHCQQRMMSGHCLVTGLYVLLGQRCPLPMQMYRQKAICPQEGVAFESRVEMVTHQIETFEPVIGTQTQVLIDSWLHYRPVRRAAQKPGWEVSGKLKSNRYMHLIYD